jgi:Domain of unknown function (DUF4082)/Bacterial Ig-like domain/Bacterial Ig domain/Secretion system C-terminal sorting domain
MSITLNRYSIGIKCAILFLLSCAPFFSSFAQNAIVTENKLAGTPESTWDIPESSDNTFGDKSIQGFATDISVNKGGVVTFKITVTTGTNKQYGIKIYRVGYYQGNGARLIADLGTAFTGITQAACKFDNTTGLTDCGNWTTSTSWTVPATAVSGIYLAKLTRSAAGGGGSSHITFIVRDDASTSALYFKTSDATWQAYNPYGGYSLYVGPGMPFNHGNKVSYNRPFLTRDGGGGGGSAEDWFMNAEYPMIRFLEKNGYDMSYITDLDIARSTANPILSHKVFLSVGHDEYWSKEERNNVEAAKTAGKHLAFFSGNEVYWKTRWENSIDGTNTAFRTMVCYKEGTIPTPAENACGGKCDPSTEWTGLWRDGCSFPSGNACKPENALSGEISWDGNTGTMVVPDTYKKLRFWRNTSVASLAAGQTATLTLGTLGYEWDWEQYPATYPPGRVTMSSTSFDGHVHKLSFYKSAAGGLVFGAGTVQWAWGLDADHDRDALDANGLAVDPPASPAMQQATVNLLADMSVQPGTLQAGLVAATASTDVTAPVTKITSPATGTTINSGSPITISGTATDANTVAAVEVSFDGGATWTDATGTTSWTISWTPPAAGTYKIIARGIDDSGNFTATASSPSITLTFSFGGSSNCPCTVFGTIVPATTAQRDNTTGIVLGVKFQSSVNGPVTGIRFYKASGDAGTHQGLLYNAAGVLLAQANFTNETATGWQQVSFSTPVQITAGQVYVASYLSSQGYYSSTDNYFAAAVVNGPLTALADGTSGSNGIYIYSPTAAFPVDTYQKSNYWVDLILGNGSPTANAGNNQTITLPVSTVTLNGTGSTGTITSYAWTKISGPNTPVITTPAAATTTVTGLIQGTYVFQLAINGGTSLSQVTVVVNPVPPPTANAGLNQSVTLPATSATLNGTGSTGTITSYAWTKISGPNTPVITTPAAATTTVTGLIQGTYVFQLSVNGGVSVSQTSVNVIPAGTITTIFTTQTSTTATENDGAALELGVKFRTTVAGYITGVRFYKTTGNSGTHTGELYSSTGTRLAQAVFTGESASGWQQVLFTSPVAITAGTTYIAAYYSSAGNYTSTTNYFATALVNGPITALADGTDGVNGVYTYSATPAFPSSSYQKSNYWVDALFSSTPPAPVANAGTNQAITLPTSSVVLNGSGSTGSISSYAWTLVSGPNTPVISTPAAVSTSVTGLIQGNYIFQLSINGGISTAQVTVTVNAVPPATANAGSNQTIVFPASSVTLSGSGSTGNITSYAWTMISGPNTAVIATPSAVNTAVTGLAEGSYVFQLSVNAGASLSQVTVNVISPTATSIFTTQIPITYLLNDGQPIELGVKFRSSTAGFVTGVRFYKPAGGSGTHTGELYSSAGQRLAQAVFTGETASGWQQVTFSAPVAITANTTYVAAYLSSSGDYTVTSDYFAGEAVNGPLTALANGTDGANGVYVYTATPAFPSSSSDENNYWVDVLFTALGDSASNAIPVISVTSPAAGATGVLVGSAVNLFYNKALDPSTVNANTIFLQNGSTTIGATASYVASENGITLTPASPLTAGTNYTVTVKGGSGTNKITDLSGNAMAKDSVWSFTTAPVTVLPIPANGPGGPILLISSTSNPFSRYPVEILRAEGWNAFNALDISAVSLTELNKYDVVVVGDIALTAAQVTMLTTWVNAGGTLIAFSPDPQLAPLLGITATGGTLSDKYLLVNTTTGPGVGIVNQTIQYHGSADLYTAQTGTSILATLYSDVSTATAYPAVTSRNVGTLGGQAIAFTYDLAKSVVYTRQGNPAWVGQNRDAQDGVIRSDNLFFGNASFDPQPDWVNLNKVSIPQADEQQRLLTNIILAGNYDRKPLPRFWFLPKGKKAAVVMTGDDHALGGTIGRMNQYMQLSSSNTPDAVANWNAIRSTSYMYTNTPISNAEIAAFQNQGFELAVHVNPDCSVWTPAQLEGYFDGQLSAFSSQYYVANPPVTHRIHCLSWSDWASLPKTELERGIRLNVSYYYWPGSWIQNRPGMFTGSGMPMRFADLDGSLIDNYQVPSQMTDESNQDYPLTIDSLLNKATGPLGYYGVFAANMHTDYAASGGSDAIIQATQALQIPVVSAKQMLDWLDGRNNSTFSNYSWANNKLGFTVIQDPKALNLKGMLPRVVAAGTFISLTQNGVAVNTTTDSIKGISYVFFDAGSGNYVATYGLSAPSGATPLVTHYAPTADTAAAMTYAYYLGQNYPNPFNQNTRINYSIPASAMVELILYDMQGRPVKIMVNELKQAGNYEYDLNTENLAHGVYFYRMRSGDYSAVKKLIIQ